VIWRAAFSNNIILVYDIKQRIEGDKYKMITKVQRHTNFTAYEDIEAIEECVNKVKRKA